MGKWDWPYRLGYTFSGNLHQYLYVPLRSPTSFRVLELQSGQPASPVRCSLVNRSLERSPQYEALSYRWGNIEDTETVECDERKVPVTRNLHRALTFLRHPERTRNLWVDALCINQRDYAERNQQLHLMRDIYRNANKVVAWIGEEMGDSELVPPMFKKLRQLEHRFGGQIYLESSSHQLRSLGLPEESAPEWSALRYFFRRAWFQRVWVIQEAVNAAHLDVMYGQTHLKWDDIVYAARCLAGSPMFVSVHCTAPTP